MRQSAVPAASRQLLLIRTMWFSVNYLREREPTCYGRIIRCFPRRPKTGRKPA
jgi:hypothetical protein